jgi:hypothetical protein
MLLYFAICKTKVSMFFLRAKSAGWTWQDHVIEYVYHGWIVRLQGQKTWE